MAVRSVIVTGGFGVLGQAVAQAFAAAGDKVARIDFAPSARVSIDGALDIGGVDLANADATQDALLRVLSAHGGIDVLVNAAGGFACETLQGGSLDVWARMASMNLMSNATVTKLALPALAKSGAGRVINIGAGAAIKAGKGMGAYAASKSGVHRLTEALAEEVAADGITVNAILPSIIDKPTNRAEMPNADFGTWVQPDVIAAVILFLASSAARAVNGALIPVSRGG